MRQLLRIQMDLFALSARPAELVGVERQTAVTLLQTLLREAVKMPTGESPNPRKDVGNE
jgi:hypothetical protein